LATYNTQAEYNAVVQSMIAVGATASLIGARRDPGQQTYYWGAGELRGRTFLVDNGATFTCAQEYCLPDTSDLLSVTQDQLQIGVNLVIYNVGPSQQLISELVPTEGGFCYTIEYSDVLAVANSQTASTANPTLFYLHEPLPYFQMEEALIKQGRFIARVFDSTQNQWIQEEFQCEHIKIWLGYYAEEDVLRLASGPDDGQIIASAADQNCDVYCNFNAPQKFEEDESVYLDSQTGIWFMHSRSARFWALSDSEVCPSNVPAGFTAVCTNSTSNDWYEVLPSAQAAAQIESGASFYPGGPFFFNVDFDQYALYFDCNCKTDYRIRLPCLGSSDIANCVLVGTSDVSTENSSYSTHSSLKHTSMDV
jgi:hypothetical protein